MLHSNRGNTTMYPVLSDKNSSSMTLSIMMSFLLLLLGNSSAWGFFNKNNPDSLYRKGASLYQSNNYKEAYDLYREAERRGSKEAYKGIARCFLEGAGVDENSDSALYYYSQSVANDSSAAHILAKIFEYRACLDSAKKYCQIAQLRGDCGGEVLRRIDNKLLLRNGNRERKSVVGSGNEAGLNMALSVLITDSTLTLFAKGEKLLGIRYYEEHEYMKAGDPGTMWSSPFYKTSSNKDGKLYPDSLMRSSEGVQYTVYDREKTNLWTLDMDNITSGKRLIIRKGIYRVRDTLIRGSNQKVIEYVTRGLSDTQKPFLPLTHADIEAGKIYYSFTSFDSPVQRRVDERDDVWVRTAIKLTPAMVTDGEFKEMKLSAVDLLKDVLLEVRALNAQAKDLSILHIAFEESVSSDRVAQIMDMANSIGFGVLSWEKGGTSTYFDKVK